MKHEIKSIGVMSLMKIYALIGLIMGVLFGGMMFVMFLFGGLSMASFGGDAASGGVMAIVIGIVVAIVAVIGCTITYAIMGAFAAIIYNIIAKMVGGVEIEFNDKSAKKE
jgi:hypothetical protein